MLYIYIDVLSYLKLISLSIQWKIQFLEVHFNNLLESIKNK